MSATHRPTLKQANKAFKPGHRSKHQLKRESARRGPESDAEPRRNVKAHATEAEVKANRRNRAAQLRKQLSAAAANSKRMGSLDGPPRTVALVSLSPTANPQVVANALALVSDDPTRVDTIGPTTHCFGSLKGRLQTIVVARELFAVLDACKVADLVVVVFGAAEPWDELGEQFASLILAQGQPTVVGVLQALDSLKPKQQGDERKAHLRYLQTRFGDEPKMLTVDTREQAILAARTLISVRLRTLHWRENRPYMLVDGFDYAQADDDQGRLAIAGYVRGVAISARQLVHLPRLGTFAIESLETLPDPAALRARGPGEPLPSDSCEPSERHSLEPFGTGEDDGSVDLGSVGDFDDEHQEPGDEAEVDESLSVTTATRRRRALLPHNYEGVGTDVVSGHALTRARPVTVRTTPHGGVLLPVVVSEAQSAWDEFLGFGADSTSLLNRGDGAGGRDAGASGDGDGFGAGGAADGSAADGGDGGSELAPDSDDELGGAADCGEYDAANPEADDPPSDADAEPRTEEEILMERQRDDFTWPDEVYLPKGPNARDLLRGYRGLKSFHDSPWDPYEELPPEYGRIVEFGDSGARIGREAVREVEEAGLPCDVYMRIVLVGVPLAAAELARASFPSPMLAFGLLRYEQQYSVLHLDVTKHPSCTYPIESGAPLIAHVGFRQLATAPVFSAVNPKADKNKVERFMQPGRGLLASLYGPVTFGQMPVLLFRDPGDGRPLELVATGKLHSVRPTTMLIKRVVLVGEPFKMHKKKATIRRMFYNPDDIFHFRKVELRTKFGRHGHILCPLGTHGHMKCVFDGVVDGRDTICMPLYARVYPRWGTEVIGATTNVAAVLDSFKLRHAPLQDGPDGGAAMDMAMI